MTEEETAIRERSNGQLASQVLDNPTYQEAFIAIKAATLTAIENTTFKQQAERDELWRELKTLSRIENRLKQTMTTGKLATEKLNSIQRATRKIRSVMG